MSRHALLSGSYAILLSLLVAEPLRCGIPTVESFATEIPAAVVITRGATPQGFAYLSGGGQRGLSARVRPGSQDRPESGNSATILIIGRAEVRTQLPLLE